MGSPGTNWIWTHGNVLDNPTLKKVAEELGRTPAQVALRWGIQMGHSVLPKSTSEKRIKENFDIFNWSIPDDMFAKFYEIKQARSFPCQFSQIAAVFIFYFLCTFFTSLPTNLI